MKRSAALALLSGLAILTACKGDGGWTPARRNLIQTRCEKTRAKAVCECAVKELTTAIPYKEFAEQMYPNDYTRIEVTSILVCESN